MNTLNISIIPSTFSVCRLPQDTAVPSWALQSKWFSITKTDDELSIVCCSSDVPTSDTIVVEGHWRALKVLGPLDFSLVGVLANLSSAMANNGISIFAISTYDTDYILVKEKQLNASIACLIEKGHVIKKYSR